MRDHPDQTGESGRRPGEDTIVSGAAAGWTAQVSIYILGFVASVLIARALGPEGRGEYYLPVTAAAAAVTIVHLSLESANTYFYAERRFSLSQLARNAGALALFAGPLGIALMFAVFALTRDSVFEGVDVEYLAIAAAVLPVQLHLLWLGGALQLAKRVSRVQMSVAAGAVVQLALITALYVADELTVTAVLIGYAASMLVPWLIQLGVARPILGIRPRLNRAVARPVLSFAVKLHLGMVFSYLLLRADIFLIGAYLDAAAVGIYSLAVIFGELALSLTSPLVVAALPYQSDMPFRAAGELSFRVARTNGVIAIGLAAAFLSSFWLVIPVLYGSAFEDAYAALAVLLPGIAAMALARPLGSWLIRRSGSPWIFGGIAFGAFMLNLGLNALLIPELGITGASLASTVSYLAFAAAFIGWGLRLSGLSARDALVPRREELDQLVRFVRGAPRALATALGRRF